MQPSPRQGPHEPHPLLEVTGLTCHPCPSLLTLFSRSGNGHLLPVRVWENLDPGHFLLTGLNSEPELDITPCSSNFSLDRVCVSRFCWVPRKTMHAGEQDFSPGTEGS